jgi:hypothetical protein
MDILVEQPCPQCGGAVTLSTEDRLLTCPYCKVKNFLVNSGPFRYALPSKTKEQSKLIYAPYLRFKGKIFSVTAAGIAHRVLDTTQEGAGLSSLAASLGLRPQAMKLTRVHKDTQGKFIPLVLDIKEIFAKAARLHALFDKDGSSQMYHQAYIGETLSLIYLPLLLKDEQILDAVVGQPILNSVEIFEATKTAQPFQVHWQTRFLATLCPRCGWSLDGEGDCHVLTCSNCNTAWQISSKGLERVACSVVTGPTDTPLYLPFWKISTKIPELEIRTFADFIERTNQPLVVQKRWQHQAMQFWVPAFKLRPEIFLRVAKQITITQRHLTQEQSFRSIPNLYPATLPLSEAKQALKVVLASSATSGRSIFSRLPQAKMETSMATLVFLPFNDQHHDWVQVQTGTVITKSILHFGRKL